MSVNVMEQVARLVVVEDEPVTRALLGGSLRAAGFEVTCVESGDGLRALPELEHVDLVLLDIELPDADGFELARWLRSRSETGIIFVSRLNAANDRVRGLELGGDDFIVKPPDLDELVARVRAVLRRRGRATRHIRLADWSFDRSRFELRGPDGVVAAVTSGEAALLELLVRARGAVVLRADLQEIVAGDSGLAATRSLDVLVHRLRRKLGEGGNVVPRIVLTVHGVGYRLGVEASWSA